MTTSKKNFQMLIEIGEEIYFFKFFWKYEKNIRWEKKVHSSVKSLCSVFKVHTPTGWGPSLPEASLSFWAFYDPLLIGCNKSCDIRIIEDIIVSCQQGQILQKV